jgi:hypothetical protein
MHKDDRSFALIRRGVEAGVLASVPQVLVPKIEERVLLEGDESADIGPRFIETLARRFRSDLPEDTKWLAASAFHFGYASVWGVLYAFAHERWRPRPWVGGLALAASIHLITFPRWGGAVLFGSERRPAERSWRQEVIFVTAALLFGLGTALIYGNGPGECESR